MNAEFEQAVRQGQHRQDPQLQVASPRVRHTRASRVPATAGALRRFVIVCEAPVKQTFLRIERCTTALAHGRRLRDAGRGLPLGMFQIVTRFVLEQPAEWSEVLIRFSLIWMVFLGIPAAFRQGAMVSVDVLYRWSAPRAAGARSTGWCAIAALALIAVIIWCGWDYAQRGQRADDGGLESVSMFWAYLAVAGGRPLLRDRHHRQPARPAAAGTGDARNEPMPSIMLGDDGAVLRAHRLRRGVDRPREPRRRIAGRNAQHAHRPSRRCSTRSTSFRWRRSPSSSWPAT